MAEPIRILLVEDSPSDVALTTEALRAARVANDLQARFLDVVRTLEGFWVEVVRRDG